MIFSLAAFLGILFGIVDGLLGLPLEIDVLFLVMACGTLVGAWYDGRAALDDSGDAWTEIEFRGNGGRWTP